MNINFNEQNNLNELPKFVSSDAVAKFIGCSKRTINRRLKEIPNLGITVHSATGKHHRVLSRKEVGVLLKHMKKGIRKGTKNESIRSDRKKAAF